MAIVTTKIQLEFDTEDIGLATKTWTEEQLKSYCASNFIDDIFDAIKHNDLQEWVTVDVRENA